MNNTNVLILSAGRVSGELEGVFGEISSGMIPLSQKPAIGWTIESLYNQGLNKFYVTTGFNGESVERYVKTVKKNNLEINCINVDFRQPPGNAIKSALKKIKGKDLLLVLGDTVFSEKIRLEEDVVYTSTDFLHPEKWCTVKTKDGKVENFFDKVANVDTDEVEALVGIYYFKDLNHLKESISTIEKEKIEISDILKNYNMIRPIETRICSSWLDLGHLDKYYQARINFSQSRYFNSLEYDSLLGVITKKSTNVEKFYDEINWYSNLPKKLSPLAPRVVDSSVSEKPFLSLEYYGYPTLAELFLFGDLSERVWSQLFHRLFRIIDLFTSYPGKVDEEDYYQMYHQKTFDRVRTAKEQRTCLNKLLSLEEIEINGRSYLGFDTLTEKVKKKILELSATMEGKNCIIHGDLCFSNILADIKSGIFRVIDPRGKWGKSPFGDIRYDIAKLRHSVSGQYDFIVNDLFNVELSDDQVNIEIFSGSRHEVIAESFDKLLQEKWDVEQIKFIEGLLFISMIPYHKDSFERQVAMYTRGVILLNETLEK